MATHGGVLLAPPAAGAEHRPDVVATAEVGAAAAPLHRFATVTAAATLFLIFAGGLVTSTGSGLAVPDWPLSFGQVMPEMKGGVFYEHGHRLVASFVGLLTVVLAVWVWRREPRRSVRWLAGAALVAVLVQGGLGGLTVLLRLPPQVSVLHACLAQGFLCLVVAVAVMTGPGWLRRAAVATVPHRAVFRLALATTATVYAQLIVGAIMRHTGAGLAIRDFPLALGEVVPPLAEAGVRIHFLHRSLAATILVLVAWTAARVLGVMREGWARTPAVLTCGLVALQVAAGALTVLSAKQPWLTSAHVVGGAGLLTACLVLTLRAARAR